MEKYNPNNCETCEYKLSRSPDQDDDGHCYMFRDEPQEICMQHTGRGRVDFLGFDNFAQISMMIRRA